MGCHWLSSTCWRGVTWGASARLTGHVGDVARGMRTLRAFNRAEAQVEVLESAGEDLRHLTMGTLRIALLSSFTLELLSSLADVVRMRQPDLSDDAVADLLTEVGLGQLATGPRALLATPAVEALRSLSTGERHRLAVLRSVLGQPRLLLLDEPGAHLDPASVATVGALLTRRAPTSTAIVVSHEPSALRGPSSQLEIVGWSVHHG